MLLCVVIKEEVVVVVVSLFVRAWDDAHNHEVLNFVHKATVIKKKLKPFPVL